MVKKKKSVEEMINELAGITASGFAHTVTKDELEKVIERLDKIDSRFQELTPAFRRGLHIGKFENLWFSKS